MSDEPEKTMPQIVVDVRGVAARQDWPGPLTEAGEAWFDAFLGEYEAAVDAALVDAMLRSKVPWPYSWLID